MIPLESNGPSGVLIRKDGSVVTARLHIGSDKEHEVYEAEVYGLLMGLELLARERGQKRAVFFIDNQAVLRTLQQGKALNSAYAYEKVEELVKRVKKMNRRIDIQTRWIPGHMDVEGNEKADEEAKRAAEGGHDTHNLLPGFLKKRIPTNPTAAKRTRRTNMDREWKDWVGETGRTERMRFIDETYPSKSFSIHALNSNLSRQEYATLVQLRLGHFPLASYLHRFKLAESPRCPRCEERSETPLHFLMGCKALENIRRDRDRACGAASRSMRRILEPGAHTAGLMKYIQHARSQGVG